MSVPTKNVSRNRSNSWSPEREKFKAYVGQLQTLNEHKNDDAHNVMSTVPIMHHRLTSLNSKHNAHSGIESHSMDSPVSKSLLNAFLKVCETKVQMDQFLKRQGSQTHYQEDNDNMSTELRMLRSSEEKLRLDLENLDTSIFLPSLCCDSSQNESHGSHSHQESFGTSSLLGHTYNVPRETQGVFLFDTKERITNKISPYDYQDIEGGYSGSSMCTSSETLPTVCTSSLHSVYISESMTSHGLDCNCNYSENGAIINQDQDAFDIISSYLFGCHDYRVKSLWNSKELSSIQYTRNIQGTVCVFLSTFAISCGLLSRYSFPYIACPSLLVSTVITFLEVKMPHQICEVRLAAFISCMYIILLIPYVNETFK